MNLIDRVFRKLREENRTALIPFLTVGDPDIPISLEIIKQLELAGADIIELGVPYSDPLADGPVIQRASQRALQHKVSILDCISMATKAREMDIQLPFIIFSYYNPILQLGLEQFFKLLLEHDISGVIIPDLPIEEDEAVRKLSVIYNIHLIPLVAPTSKERMLNIAQHAAGFVYCVSSLGVTGERAQFHKGVDSFIATVREATHLPVAVGFGISNNEQFKHFSSLCDGVIVGSAIVRKIEEVLPLLAQAETKDSGLLQIRQFVAQLKA